MATYIYFCEPQDKEFEEDHSIMIVLEVCPECEKLGLPAHKPKRLISYATPGTVTLAGQDLVDKVKSDAKQMQRDASLSPHKYANLIGETRYQNLQSNIDRHNR